MSEPLEIVLSPKTTVTVVELNAAESFAPDRIIGDDFASPIYVAKVYAICSVRSINGRPVTPCANATEFKAVASAFSMTEAMVLAQKYNEIFAPPVGDELKNESAAEPSEA